MHVAAVIAAGGRGERLGAGQPKQLLTIGGRTMLEHAVEAFVAHALIGEVVVVVPREIVPTLADQWQTALKPVRVVAGGPRRQDSVANGLAVVEARADVVVVHDAARPFVSAALIARTVAAAADSGAALAAMPSHDTVKYATAEPGAAPMVERTIPRERVYLAQTPQAFRTSVLRAAFAAQSPDTTATDEAALVEAAGFPVRLVAGEPTNLKVTTPADLEVARAMADTHEGPALRVGTGYDLHRLVEGRPLILGGVTVPHTHGLAGHSDADVIAHAVTDALLGAVGRGDIGRHFPDTDPRWKGADSLAMLAHAAGLVREAGYRVANVDAVLIAERPKIVPYIPAMQRTLAETIGIDAACVSVKGKTNEGVGDLGRGEAMAVHAVALVARAADR